MFDVFGETLFIDYSMPLWIILDELNNKQHVCVKEHRITSKHIDSPDQSGLVISLHADFYDVFWYLTGHEYQLLILVYIPYNKNHSKLDNKNHFWG